MYQPGYEACKAAVQHLEVDIAEESRRIEEAKCRDAEKRKARIERECEMTRARLQREDDLRIGRHEADLEAGAEE